MTAVGGWRLAVSGWRLERFLGLAAQAKSPAALRAAILDSF